MLRSRILIHLSSFSKVVQWLCLKYSNQPLWTGANAEITLWRLAESSSSSYGLVIHLLLLSTTHCCAAVAFGYRPESVYLERTSTSLTAHAFRRTIALLTECRASQGRVGYKHVTPPE